jgi:hypothetical protein
VRGIDQEPVEEPTHRCHPREVGRQLSGLKIRVTSLMVMEEECATCRTTALACPHPRL